MRLDDLFDVELFTMYIERIPYPLVRDAFASTPGNHASPSLDVNAESEPGLLTIPRGRSTGNKTVRCIYKTYLCRY